MALKMETEDGQGRVKILLKYSLVLYISIMFVRVRCDSKLWGMTVLYVYMHGDNIYICRYISIFNGPWIKIMWFFKKHTFSCQFCIDSKQVHWTIRASWKSTKKGLKLKNGFSQPKRERGPLDMWKYELPSGC